MGRHWPPGLKNFIEKFEIHVAPLYKLYEEKIIIFLNAFQLGYHGQIFLLNPLNIDESMTLTKLKYSYGTLRSGQHLQTSFTNQEIKTYISMLVL